MKRRKLITVGVRARKARIFLAILIGVAALFYTAAFAMAGSRASDRPASGPAWADPRQTGVLTDKGFERAKDYLKNKYGKYAGQEKKASQQKGTSTKP